MKSQNEIRNINNVQNVYMLYIYIQLGKASMYFCQNSVFKEFRILLVDSVRLLNKWKL